jgi:hypothetical protein
MVPATPKAQVTAGATSQYHRKYLVALAVHCLILTLYLAALVVYCGRWEHRILFDVDAINTVSSFISYVAQILLHTLLALALWSTQTISENRVIHKRTYILLSLRRPAV